jgi:Flp pilus assembly protein TadD
LSDQAERLDEARGLALRAREALPDDADVARVLGVISFRKGEKEYAMRLLEESAGKADLNAEGLFCLGMAYLENGREEDGKKTLKKALDKGLSGSELKEAESALKLEKKPSED